MTKGPTQNELEERRRAIGIALAHLLVADIRRHPARVTSAAAGSAERPSADTVSVTPKRRAKKKR